MKSYSLNLRCEGVAGLTPSASQQCGECLSGKYIYCVVYIMEVVFGKVRIGLQKLQTVWRHVGDADGYVGLSYEGDNDAVALYALYLTLDVLEGA